MVTLTATATGSLHTRGLGSTMLLGSARVVSEAEGVSTGFEQQHEAAWGEAAGLWGCP